MSATQCLTCRWWNGDRKYAAESFDEKNKHGMCQHIYASPAHPDDWPARLYPIGTTAWLQTRYDFSCRDWRALPAEPWERSVSSEEPGP